MSVIEIGKEENSERFSLESSALRLGDLIFLAAIPLVSLTIHPGLYHAYSAPKYAFLAAFSMLLLPVTGFMLLVSSRRFSIPVAYALLLFAWIIINFISAFSSTNLKIAITEAGFFAGCAVFSLRASEYHRRERLFSATAIIISLVVIISAIYGFLQYTGRDILNLESPDIPVSFFGNPNFAAQYLVAALPLLAAFCWSGPFRILFISSFCVGTIHLFLLKSRGGIIAGAAGFLFFIIAFMWMKRKSVEIPGFRLIRLNSKNIIILVIGMILLFGTYLYLDQGETVTDLYSSFSAGPETNRYRLLAWKSGLEMAMDHPLIGVGPGHYRFYHPFYSTGEFWRLKGVFGRIRHIRAHNDYLNILAETGIMGFAAFVAIISYLFVRIIRAARISSSEEPGFRRKLWICGLGGGIFATLVQSLVDFNLYNTSSGFLFWIMAGFLAALTGSGISSTNGNPFYRKISGILIILLSVIALIFVPPELVHKLRAELLLRRANVAFQNQNFSSAAKFASDALKEDNNNIDALAIMADSFRNIPGRSLEAVKAYQYWSNLEPGYPPVYNRMGEALYKAGEKNQARMAFRKALDINPVSVPALLNLGNLHLGNGNVLEALKYYRRADEIGGELVKQNEAQYGIALAEAGRYSEAVSHLEAGLSVLPEKAPLILKYLARTYRALGEDVKADEALEIMETMKQE